MSEPITVSYDPNVIQYETIQTTGLYEITAVGASGGGITPVDGLGGPGGGASISADFELTSGEVLKILVGGEGGNGFTENDGGGGGGGTFITAVGVQLLEVAGGGGGRGSGPASRGYSGNYNTNGTAAYGRNGS